MLLRRKRGSREVPIAESTTEDETALPMDFPDSGPNPEDSCLQREQERILSAAINELTPGMREQSNCGSLASYPQEKPLKSWVCRWGSEARYSTGGGSWRKTLKRYVESTRKYGNQVLRTQRTVS